MPYATPRSARKWVVKITSLDLFLTYILFFPPFMHMIGQSYSLGIVICAVSLLPLYSKFIFSGSAKVRTFLLITFFLIYVPISLLANNGLGRGPDLTNWILGLLAIISLMVLASIFSHIYHRELILEKNGPNNFPFFTVFVIYSHFILFLKFAEFYTNYADLSTRIGLFIEPSHICYITAIFLFMKFSYSTNRMFAVYFLGAILFVFSVKSLVGLVTLFLVAFVLASRMQKIVLFMSTALALFFFSTTIFNIYFNSEEPTLTGLVYLSGWERALINTLETNLIGLGVNQFGVYGNQGLRAEIIELLTGGPQANRFDGSFIFAKLTGEFGIFSLLLTVYLANLWFKCYTKNQYINNYFTLGLVSSFFILFFLRSPGYVCGASAIMISLLTNPQLMKNKSRIPNAKFGHR